MLGDHIMDESYVEHEMRIEKFREFCRSNHVLARDCMPIYDSDGFIIGAQLQDGYIYYDGKSSEDASERGFR